MKRGKHIILGLIWMFFIISLSVTVTLNFRPLYYPDIDSLNISERSGLPEDEIRANYDVLIDYNNFWGPETLEFPTLAMSETGRIHFEEVKVIFVALEYMAIVTGILAIAGAVWMKKQGENLYLKYTSILTVGVPALVGAGIAINWDKAFVIFHKIFFRNDYWIFSADTDPVITILPDTFFLHCAVMILALVVLGSVICSGIYIRAKKTA